MCLTKLEGPYGQSLVAGVEEGGKTGCLFSGAHSPFTLTSLFLQAKQPGKHLSNSEQALKQQPRGKHVTNSEQALQQQPLSSFLHLLPLLSTGHTPVTVWAWDTN